MRYLLLKRDREESMPDARLLDSLSFQSNSNLLEASRLCYADLSGRHAKKKRKYLSSQDVRQHQIK